jgi:hypothetical protein
MSDKSPQKRILVVIPTSTLTRRQLLEGLLEYAHESASGPWQFHLGLHDLNRRKGRAMRICEGTIAYFSHCRSCQACRTRTSPCDRRAS